MTHDVSPGNIYFAPKGNTDSAKLFERTLRDQLARYKHCTRIYIIQLNY